MAVDTAKALDPEEFRRQGHQVIDLIADYYGRMGGVLILPRNKLYPVIYSFMDI